MPPPATLPTPAPDADIACPSLDTFRHGGVATPYRPQPTGLCPSRCEALVRVIEAAPQVRRRHQFFIWSQGSLQDLLPHRLAVCGAYQRRRKELVHDAFHSVVLPEAMLEVLGDGRSALMRSVGNAWVEGGGRALTLEMAPLVGNEPIAANRADPATAQRGLLLDCGIEQLLVHGVSRPQRPMEIESLFVFATPGARAAPQHALHLELLLPSLHSTWRRVQALEDDLSLSPSRGGRGPAHGALSAREREILAGLCEGLSNQRVADRLGISPLTVKNHVQTILRKLGVANRTQAVASALSLELLTRDA